MHYTLKHLDLLNDCVVKSVDKGKMHRHRSYEPAQSPSVALIVDILIDISLRHSGSEGACAILSSKGTAAGVRAIMATVSTHRRERR
jgi:hypothetical protein